MLSIHRRKSLASFFCFPFLLYPPFPCPDPPKTSQRKRKHFLPQDYFLFWLPSPPLPLLLYVLNLAPSWMGFFLLPHLYLPPSTSTDCCFPIVASPPPITPPACPTPHKHGTRESLGGFWSSLSLSLSLVRD